MKVFISWSGQRAQSLGEAVRDWLPSVIQAVEPYFSPDDTAKGTRWDGEISKVLEECIFGICIITPESKDAPWMLYEAGALGKLGKSRVFPLLFGMQPTDLKPPLANLNATAFDKIDVRRMVHEINKQLDDKALDEKRLERAFESFWPDFEARVGEVLARKVSANPHRSDSDVVRETLDVVRSMAFEMARLRRSIDFDNDATAPWGAGTEPHREIEPINSNRLYRNRKNRDQITAGQLSDFLMVMRDAVELSARQKIAGKENTPPKQRDDDEKA